MTVQPSGQRSTDDQIRRRASIHIDEPPANTRRKASLARLIQKVYEVDPLDCANRGSSMRIVALIAEVHNPTHPDKRLSSHGDAEQLVYR